MAATPSVALNKEIESYLTALTLFRLGGFWSLTPIKKVEKTFKTVLSYDHQTKQLFLEFFSARS